MREAASSPAVRSGVNCTLFEDGRETRMHGGDGHNKSVESRGGGLFTAVLIHTDIGQVSIRIPQLPVDLLAPVYGMTSLKQEK